MTDAHPSLRPARPPLLSLMLLLAACQPAPTQTRIQGSTMGTYAVTLGDPFPGGQGALHRRRWRPAGAPEPGDLHL